MIDIEIDSKNGVPSTDFGLGLYLGIEEHHLLGRISIFLGKSKDFIFMLFSSSGVF